MVLKLFVDPSASISQKCILSPANGQAIGLPNGGQVQITDESTNKSTICAMEVNADVLDFSIKIAIDVIGAINFNGLELAVDKAGGVPISVAVPKATPAPAPAVFSTTNPSIPSPMPKPTMPTPTPMAMPTPSQMSMPKPTMPTPTPMAMPTPSQMSMPKPTVAMPASTPSIMSSPSISMPTMPSMTPNPSVMMSPPGMSTPPGMMAPPSMSSPPGMIAPPSMSSPPGMIAPPSMSSPPGMMAPPGITLQMPSPTTSMDMAGVMDPNLQIPAAPPIPVDPYPNKIDINELSSQKMGSLILKAANTGLTLEGKVLLSQNLINRLGIYPNALVGWEDPLTRGTGSARVKVNQQSDLEIVMDGNTKGDTNVQSDQVVVFSMEPPITHVDVVTLEVEGKPEFNGYIQVNHRNAMSLGVQEGDILAFEDDLTGAFGAAKVSFNENVPNAKIYIDQELLEASGVGSFSVNLKKNVRQIVPLQSIDLGIAPITGEKVWEVISFARTNITSIRQWLGNYTIYKGIKLRWKTANTALEVLNTVPDLTGDVLATVTANTTLNLRPTGLVTFNAVLLLDISRSMMARDCEVTNIGPALEGIKAAMHDPEIQEFCKAFKPGTMVPRRMSAAFGAILFLAEKVGRGFGEKVSIIRFADEAQVLTMPDGKLWMDSSSGQKGVLESTARKIVSDIANAYGQATNMGPAMKKCVEIVNMFKTTGTDQPTMVVMLTDGTPTDGNAFFEGVQQLSQNPNVILYIIGLGNPDDEQMKKAASLCGGEYFKPKDTGELLVWYSKRARDLQVKLKHQ